MDQQKMQLDLLIAYSFSHQKCSAVAFSFPWRINDNMNNKLNKLK